VPVALLVLIVGAGLGVFAQADQAAADRVPRGVVIGGVPVGHLRSADAVARLEKEIGAPARRSVRVRLEGRTYRLSARRAGVRVDLRSLVRRAVDSGREGNFLQRGWRELTNAEVDEREAVRISVDRGAVKKFVEGLAAKVARPAVDARLTMTVNRVSVSESKSGQRLARGASLVKRIERAFTRSGASRRLTAHTETVAPTQTAAQVWAAHPTVVTVSHDAKRVTVFEHGQAAVSFHVAVGDPKYPTPYGQFVVQTMQKNPPWNVPNSDWAGELAGKTIPGGDPRNPLVARWIGFNGSVGFHGTKDLASLGRAASHGCVRMDPKDVKDLYARLQVGTPVVVGD
jgi:lipoprotein-anchoring transpeptidase ErfK/SrfK